MLGKKVELQIRTARRHTVCSLVIRTIDCTFLRTRLCVCTLCLKPIIAIIAVLDLSVS